MNRPALSLLCRELLFEFDQRSFCVIRIDFPGFDCALAGVERSRKLLIGKAGIRCVVSRRQNELSQLCSDRIDPLFGHFLAAGGSSKNDAKGLRHLLRFVIPLLDAISAPLLAEMRDTLRELLTDRRVILRRAND